MRVPLCFISHLFTHIIPSRSVPPGDTTCQPRVILRFIPDVNSVVGHYSPLADDETVLQEGDVLKM